jgi:hypothetical protein
MFDVSARNNSMLFSHSDWNKLPLSIKKKKKKRGQVVERS